MDENADKSPESSPKRALAKIALLIGAIACGALSAILGIFGIVLYLFAMLSCDLQKAKLSNAAALLLGAAAVAMFRAYRQRR